MYNAVLKNPLSMPLVNGEIREALASLDPVKLGLIQAKPAAPWRKQRVM